MSIRSPHKFARALALLGAVTLNPSLPAAIDYAREVKPLLTEHCSKCHGASQQKGDLRLDTAAAARKGGENGPALQPGQSANSLLLQSVRGTHDTISQMPYKKPPLADAQIALLAKWIDEGASAPAEEQPGSVKHWSFIPPTRPPVPPIQNPKSKIRLMRSSSRGSL